MFQYRTTPIQMSAAAQMNLATDFVKPESGVVSDFLKWLHASPSQFHAVGMFSVCLRYIHTPHATPPTARRPPQRNERLVSDVT